MTFVRPDGNVTQTVTDNNGKFTTAAKLSAGAYKVNITKDEFLTPDEMLTAFTLASDDSGNYETN